ncbi:MAG: hypothetical protein J6N45_09750 [Alphaproteobacteria bacterium]|nr:hypothetical protein [Alphaproteobacteria bacterium]
MGLFSSKSSSSSKTETNYNDSSTTTTNAAEVGSASSDNRIIGTGGSYIEQGLTGDNLNSVLGYSESLYDKSYNTLSQTISSVQSSAEKAIQATGDAYAESKNELRNAIDGIRPIAFYAAIAASLYFIFRKG